jgi:glutamine---fructose-6-phosphate transaminase (isomerizing)
MAPVESTDDRQRRPSRAYDDIRSQPEAVERTIESVLASGASIVASLARARRVFVVGEPAGRHTAVASAAMLGSFSRGKIDARGLSAFDFSEYARGLRPDDLMLALSPSTGDIEITGALDRARRTGMETVAIGGVPTGALASHTLPLAAAATPTTSWTVFLSAVAALANELADPHERLDLRPLPDAIGESLDCEPIAHSLAATLVAATRAGVAGTILIVGGGPNVATARQAADVLARLPGVITAGMAVDEAALALPAWVDENTLLILLAPPGAATARATDVASRAATIGLAPVALVTDDNVDDFPDCHRIILPSGVPEHLTPITSLPPLQLLAHYLSIGLNSNVDSPD